MESRPGSTRRGTTWRWIGCVETRSLERPFWARRGGGRGARRVGRGAALTCARACARQVIGFVRGKSVLHPHGFFGGGFGDLRALEGFADDLVSRRVRMPPPVMPCVSLAPAVPVGLGGDGMDGADGSFPTTCTVPGFLPPESLTARFQLVTPRLWRAAAGGGGGGSRPVVVLLPGTGEHGFLRRRHLISRPLARAGIASLILEGPYYGPRRPRAQRGSKVFTGRARRGAEGGGGG